MNGKKRSEPVSRSTHTEHGDATALANRTTDFHYELSVSYSSIPGTGWNAWLGFRPLTRGFSVLALLSEGKVRLTRIAKSTKALSWRSACQALLMVDESWLLCGDFSRQVRIKGLHGWQASLLAACWFGDDYTHRKEVALLCSQEEAVLVALDSGFHGGLLGDACLDTLADVIELFGDDLSLSSICEGSVSQASICKAIAARKVDLERLEKEAQHKRESSLAAFSDDIATLYEKLTGSWPKPSSYSAGMADSIRKNRVANALRTFVQEHQRLPTGKELKKIEQTPTNSHPVGSVVKQESKSRKIKPDDINAVCKKIGIRRQKHANPERYQLESNEGVTVRVFGAHHSRSDEQREPAANAAASSSEHAAMPGAAPEAQDPAVPTDQVEDEDGGDDWSEDNEEEGTEHCPICGAESDWGSTKTCEHFIGMLFDSSILDCSVLSSLSDAWTTLDRLEAHYNEELLWALARRRNVDYETFNFYMRNRDELVGDLSAGELLERASELFGLHVGSLTTTGGMLSGSATTIYAANPEFLRALDADLCGLANEIEEAHREYSALGTAHR